MSKRGDLAYLRQLIFAELDERAPQPLPAEHPQRPWAQWLGLPLQHGPAVATTGAAPFEFDATDLRDRGILPEVAYGCLVQTWWHPQQAGWVARTRSEILACYRSEELDKPGWTLTLPEVERINAYRLQELTPEELLEACIPYCPRPPDTADNAAMEGWVLLHLEGFRRLQDVADCLRPFFLASTGLGWAAERVESALQATQAPADLAGELRLPPQVDWPTAVSLLGADRVRRLLS